MNKRKQILDLTHEVEGLKRRLNNALGIIFSHTSMYDRTLKVLRQGCWVGISPPTKEVRRAMQKFK